MTGKPPPKLEPVSRTCLLHFSHTFGVDVRVFGCEPASCLCVRPSCMTIATLHACAETFLCSAHGRVEGNPHPARGDTVLALPNGGCVPRQTRRVQQQDHGLVRRNRACHRAARKALVCCVRSRGCITLAASVHQAPWASTGVLSTSLRVCVSGDVQIQLLASPHDLPDGRQDLIARYCFNTSALPTETLIPLNAKAVRGAGCGRRFGLVAYQVRRTGARWMCFDRRWWTWSDSRCTCCWKIQLASRSQSGCYALCCVCCRGACLDLLALRHVCRSVRGMDDRTPQLTSLRKYNLRGLEADYLGAPG